MNILVLGGNGFIGSHIVDSLLEAGHSVRVFDRISEAYREPLHNVEYHFGNFDDQFLLAKALQGIDAVVHLISTSVPSTSNLDPASDVSSNLISTIELFELMRKQNISRILFMSSGGTVYGNPTMSPIPEDHPLDPISSYGIVKVAIEKYLFMYQQLYGFNPIILRASNPYGPRQGNAGLQGLIGTFLSRMLAKKPLVVWGSGEVIRDYLHIEDLARLSVKAVGSTETGVFNAGSGEGFSINQIIATLNDVVGYAADVKYEKNRDFDVKKVVLDNSKAMTVFDWKADTGLLKGVQSQMGWLKSLK